MPYLTRTDQNLSSGLSARPWPVAAGHDNCHYDSYESQLERTLTPAFLAAGMVAEVQNAWEGGGCGDTHQNQVYCITQKGFTTSGHCALHASTPSRAR